MDPTNYDGFYSEYLETSLTGEMQDLVGPEEVKLCVFLFLVYFCNSHYLDSILILDRCEFDTENRTLLIDVYLPTLPRLDITISL